MATIIKIPRQLAPTMGHRVTTAGVKFRTGSPSTLGEKVASGLVMRFGTIDCVNDKLDCFEDGFSDDGSFLNVGGHRFYIAITKSFPEEVTEVSDRLYDAGLSCSESSNLGAMVEVLALGDEEGANSPHTARPPLERLLPQEQVALLPEQDTSDIPAIVDLRAPLDHAINPVQAAEALEQTHTTLPGKAVDLDDTRRRADSTIREFYTAQCTALAREVRNHGPLAIDPSWFQMQRVSSSNQGQVERSQSIHAPSRRGGGHRAQRSGSHHWHRHDPAPLAGPGGLAH
jgi:hypothetical protein